MGSIGIGCLTEANQRHPRMVLHGVRDRERRLLEIAGVTDSFTFDGDGHRPDR